MSVFMQPIYTQTVGVGGTASITFNNIPQGFTDLKLVISGRGSNSDFYSNVMMSFNGSSALYFTDTLIYANASSVTGTRNSYGAGGSVLDGYITAATGTANTFGAISVYIPNYTSGNYKQIIADSTTENNSTSNYLMSLSSNLWRNTAPITSLTVTAGGNNFVQYSTFTLYGISNVYDVTTPTAPTIGTVTDQSGFASVAFTPAANDKADAYVVTSSPSGSTTYGAMSPIVTPATLATSYTYQVASVNSLGSSASSASSALTTSNSFASIATFAFTDNSSASVSFTAIPQNYTHLQLRVFARGSAAATTQDILITFNGDTSSSYWQYHQMFSTGANSYSNYGTTAANMIAHTIPAASALASAFGSAIIDIHDYTSPNKNKSIKSLQGYNLNGSGNSVFRSNMYTGLAPISSITLAVSNFAQYSHIALYGLA